MLRIEETDEEVDLRPRRPAEGRRYEECGVRGAGESEDRLWDPRRDRGIWLAGVCVLGVAVMVEPCRIPTPAGDRRGSAGDLLCGVFSVEASLLVPGDLARFAESISQCFSVAS